MTNLNNGAKFFSCLRAEQSKAATMTVFTASGTLELDEAKANSIVEFWAKKTVFNPIFKAFGAMDMDEVRGVMNLAMVKACKDWMEGGNASVWTRITGALKMKHVSMVATAKRGAGQRFENGFCPAVDGSDDEMSVMDSIPSELTADGQFSSLSTIESILEIARQIDPVRGQEYVRQFALGLPNNELTNSRGRKVTRQAASYARQAFVVRLKERLEASGITAEVFMR